MNPEDFEALVRRLEEQARRDPAGYRIRVLLLALSGNLYLGTMVLLICALLAAAIASAYYLGALGAKIALVVGVFLWIVLRALWIRAEPPPGAELSPRSAPELFEMIDELRRRLQGPRFHRVLVTDELNAGVAQLPRMGAFGWHRNYLFIGLPLMMTLTVEQFKAVLAHEFGHLARSHGAVSNWIYRQRLRWARLMGMLEAVESSGAVLFRPFLHWYAPYFNAYSYPLARANEFEADATSARLASPGALAAALTASSVIGRYLDERYWPRINRQADYQPQPSFTPFAGMGPDVAAGLDPRAAAEWIEHAMAIKPTLDDTHPSLQERLDALGQTARLALPATGESADRLLGPSLEGITLALDRRWQERILPAWQEHYQRMQDGRRRLAELDRRHAAGEELSIEEAYDRARLTAAPGGNAGGAIEQLRALHARVPGNAEILLTLGEGLLVHDDDTGRAQVERSMELDDRCIVKGCEVLRDYSWRKGLQDEARAWERRLSERLELEQAAAREREIVRSTDKFERHGLDAETLGRLQAQLRSIPRLKKVYFVRKRVKLLPERGCYVLGFRIRGFWHSNKDITEVQEQIQRTVQLPAGTVILSIVGRNYEFSGKFRWMRGSRIV
jgi:Zn-dependent protease with chaperone function